MKWPLKVKNCLVSFKVFTTVKRETDVYTRRKLLRMSAVFLQHDCSPAGFMQRKQQYTSAKLLFQTDRYVGVHWDEEQYLIWDINYKIMIKEPVHTSWCIAVKINEYTTVRTFNLVCCSNIAITYKYVCLLKQLVTTARGFWNSVPFLWHFPDQCNISLTNISHDNGLKPQLNFPWLQVKFPDFTWPWRIFFLWPFPDLWWLC